MLNLPFPRRRLRDFLVLLTNVLIQSVRPLVELATSWNIALMLLANMYGPEMSIEVTLPMFGLASEGLLADWTLDAGAIIRGVRW